MSDNWGDTLPGTPERYAALHEHYAANALVTGHTPECEKVTKEVNWPTLSGRVLCTCGAADRGSWGERFEYEGARYDPSDESLPDEELI